MGLGVALLATLLAAWFAPEPEDDGVVLNPRPASPAASRSVRDATAGIPAPARNASAVASVEVLQIRERLASDEDEISLFAVADWQQRKVPDAVENQMPEEAPPPPPVAPPLPFRMMGRYVENGQTLVFLQQADRNWIVREGDILNESYKVESVGANAIHFKYLPLGEVQILETGGTL
jgi:hypothetical protein